MSSRRALLASAAVLGLGALARAQQPLFTFVQVSDSQPQTSSENQRFVDVLRTISEGGTAGALLPRRVDLVLFAGDITWGNTRTEWVAAKQKLDTWLTANDIPFLAVPGNHDVDNSNTSLYEEFIASSDVWDVGSAAFTGHNGKSRTTLWNGIRFLGINNSNPGWNTVSSADLADLATRVNAARAASENVFILCHHPHDEKGRIPLASVLPNPSAVGYLHGHLGSPSIKKGLAGVANPNLWDVNTNAIYLDRALVYFEVFATELRAHVIELDLAPTSLPPATLIPLVHPLTPAGEPSHGLADATHIGARTTPSARAPERKLWFHAGSFWGVLWSEGAAAWRIQRLERTTQNWIDTGPTVATDPARSFDALASADELVLASNVATSPGQAGAGRPGQVLRYLYDVPSAGYVLQPGFPVAVNDSRTPTLVIERDEGGTLWAAWTRAGAVLVNRSLATDSSWDVPTTVATGIGGADTVALVKLAGELGLFWSDTADGMLRFARHLDGDPAASWTSETVTLDASLVGASFDARAVDGRVLAAVRGANGSLNLFVRALGGGWSTTPLADTTDALDAPTLVVDRSFGLLRLFATGPTLGGQTFAGGGAIYLKQAPLATLDFPRGRGTPLIQDGGRPSAHFAGSTRQEVDAASGLAVLASVSQNARYWHAFDALTTPGLAPTASFSASPRNGSVPLVVSFNDLSSGVPTFWHWDFGDGQVSEAQQPQHVYAAPGTYTVSLTVANGRGENVLTQNAFVTVTPPSPVLTFRPVADARVSQASPGTNYGTDPALRVKSQSGTSFQSFLRFDLTGLAGTVASAKLRFLCTDPSTSGGSLYKLTNSSWTETGINWNNKPALPGSALAILGEAVTGVWLEQEIGAANVSAGLLNFALGGGSSNSAFYSSREGANPPELVVTLVGAGTPPTADFTAAPLSGQAPLAVSFSDLSGNNPSAWNWDFGDGTSSSERNPQHVYNAPGTYAVVLDVTNAAGFDSRTRLDYIVVDAPAPVRTFLPVADARVYEASPGGNFGTDVTLRVKNQAGSSFQTYFKFDLSSLSGDVLSARLRLFCTDDSNSGGRLYAVASTWTETGLTWNNRPALPATSLGAYGAVGLNTWVELDVTSAVSGPGILALGLAGGSTNSAFYSSREGANPPQLVVTTGTLTPPTADFSGAPRSGPAPLAVTFGDLSSGASAWVWDFGDGTGASTQNPVHVYTAPGSYTVTLSASNAAGSASVTRTGYVVVSAPAASVTLFPVADARVNEASPSSNAGTDIVLRVREAAGGSYHTYLRFDLSAVSAPILSAKLRLFSTDGSDVAGRVFPAPTGWSETAITWNNKPAPSGALITTTGTVGNNAWAEFDLTPAVTPGGLLAFVLQSSSTNSCFYSSREGANPPELVLTLGTP